ncbi:nucleotidyl transferase AbiEii/AbiGii toxin family protein [Actinoplanes couchii]|uniref:nucleotidyl transferase AbiEii/AbiGii toxin family protein n=1 Tax=Actinoplanes couchii TaxID=403638 RepID=UPI00194414C9|nr:nucleotidyl transferase AbiEii/AbiGii toxin family protein [Actinoplanes couchii]MDR6319435.1 hypothetical protein [Actinoplanes couchii]
MHGEFEIHLTVLGDGFADGLKFSDIVLAGGDHPRQPMLSYRAWGSLDDIVEAAHDERTRLRDCGLRPVRLKIEAHPDNSGVPVTDAAPGGRYFEHHVKLRLPDAGTSRLAALIGPFGAGLSRNARRPDSNEMFVTQRCYRAGLAEAREELARLVEALTAEGHEILEVEMQYVVCDTAPEWDGGWITGPVARVAPAGPAPEPSGRPDPWPWSLGRYDKRDLSRRTAPLDAVHALLGRIAASPWADRLVLCGSVALRAQLGEATRVPADIDLIAVPYLPELWNAGMTELRAGLIGLAGDPGLVEDRHLWEYHDAPGLRLGYRSGADDPPVMVDVVLGEEMLMPPEPLEVVPGVRMLAVPPALALAAKLRWLGSEEKPKAKDLYDAVLLAEHTTVDPAVVRALLRWSIGPAADRFGPETAREWTVDWDDLRRACPYITGDLDSWRERLVLALRRPFRPGG